MSGTAGIAGAVSGTGGASCLSRTAQQVRLISQQVTCGEQTVSVTAGVAVASAVSGTGGASWLSRTA
ncbi:MAG: hypothetical protein LBK25_06980 [Treponema sp.]|nr:hypothetical protein [Treponema sp.]